MLDRLGYTYFPAAFCMAAGVQAVFDDVRGRDVADRTGVVETTAVTPALPLPPTPVGKLTEVALPTWLLHAELMRDR